MRIARAVPALALVLLIAPTASCKKSGPAAPGPYDQTLTGSVSSFRYTSHLVETPRDGTLTVTLTWNGAVDLDLYLTGSNCGDIYGDPPCSTVAVSASASGQSETITRTVSKGEGIKAWVDNFTDAQANYELRVVIE